MQKGTKDIHLHDYLYACMKPKLKKKIKLKNKTKCKLLPVSGTSICYNRGVNMSWKLNTGMDDNL